MADQNGLNVIHIVANHRLQLICEYLCIRVWSRIILFSLITICFTLINVGRIKFLINGGHNLVIAGMDVIA